MAKENQFEKTVIKATIATASAVVVVFATLILVFSFGFPSLMGKFCKNTGFYGLAAGFYEKAYERSEKAEDFSAFMDCAVFLADKSGDYDKAATIGEDVIKFKDELSEDDYCYFAVSVVRAKYALGDKASAAEFAVNASYQDRTLPLDYAKMLAEKDGELKLELDKFLN